jgi:hypothetical protein
MTGGPALLAFLQFDGDGRFVGGLSDPVPIDVLPDGSLRLRQSPERVVQDACTLLR